MGRRRNFLDWPFFAPEHREVADRLDDWAAEHISQQAHDPAGLDEKCRALVTLLGAAGWTRYSVPYAAGAPLVSAAGAAEVPYVAPMDALPRFDVRALALIRETLAYHDGLADFAFAMQGLGSGAISLAGSPQLQAHYLPQVAAGRSIAAFALSEPGAGSDVAALDCSARRDGDAYVLDGAKTWISNGGIADFYCVFARTQPAQLRPDGSVSARGISAFVVDAGLPGFVIQNRIDVIAPHPLATLAFSGCRVPATHRLGAEGDGFKLAMRTLDVFRTSVAGAALGFAQRALDETVRHVLRRPMFGRMLADLQMTQATLADMASGLEAARLLTYRAAWRRDRGERATQDVAMAKMSATETAQRVIDAAVQLLGATGIVQGAITERLYRDIRALRIYEGATEVQKLIISRELLEEARAGQP